MAAEPDLTIGIEEEYLLLDPETYDLVDAPDDLVADCEAALGQQVTREFLRCQIEVGTRVCRTVQEARDDLARLRSGVSDCARAHGLVPVAASSHPLADWTAQTRTEKERYAALEKDYSAAARRMLISGMHVHIGIPDRDMRIDLMNQLSYFLPHLLAMSASSPFWKGQDTGMASYRLTVFDNMPRTGLPPRLASWSEFSRITGLLTELGLIEDGSRIWWDMRPSAGFPTLETRICDIPARLSDTVTLAALLRCLARMLWRLSAMNQRWRIYESVLLSENRWRAARYGMSGGLIDYGRGEIVPFADLAAELVELVAEDAEALGCTEEVHGLLDISARGNGADRQRAVFAKALSEGADTPGALRAVLAHLSEEFTADL
ncbi:carboxylate-amine ligase [Roseicyclus sp. F158]|uniref:Putative glutamate--cysteine ligase 2 n=1 Tax=Tropicimonas omnivorans TaxID=3075590 RepID=A0ABU3DJ80_9RHOB|nr:carboxylate-amine ligase [Roseicyclus sp. F158]MDT0683776.1 carboxylate-amine ligase [Roseicyclus sp. F158]